MKLNGLRAKIRPLVFAQIDLKYCTIKLKDGSTPTPNEITVKIGEGNLTYSEKREMEYVRDRGLLDTVREGDEQPIDVTMDFTWEWLKGLTTSGAVPTIEDALKNRGAASDWVSSSADPCEPYCVDIQVFYSPPCGETYDEVIVLPDFRQTDLSHDLRAGTVSITGQCNATEATVTRVAHTSTY